MNVMNILSKKLSAGDILVTPVQRKEFTIENISPKGITLVLGTQWKTEIPANCWEGIPDFLKGKGWVVIGAIHDYGAVPGTLEDYVNKTKPQKRSTGNYVASVLEIAGIAEINRKPPSKIRLIT
jgi:hypothetical protein